MVINMIIEQESIDRESFYTELEDIFGKNGLADCLDDEVKERFFALTGIMLLHNSKMNLTALTKSNEIILKHYADSITAAKYMPKTARVIDVGCGAGFPALPLAIVRGDIEISALDSTAKRIEYVKNTARELKLKNIDTLCARAEGAAHDIRFRESFDVACARAVARMETLCEYCLPYVKVGGKFIAMKAKPDEAELEGAKRAAGRLGGSIEKTERFTITDGGEVFDRTIIVIKKLSPTPKTFPRNNAQISKKPL